MDNSSTASYWVTALMIVILAIAAIAWYVNSTVTPALPNTGTDTTTTDQNSTGATG